MDTSCDVVYVCRAGDNEELRYSLRSLVNLPHDRVWIFGAWPEWVKGAKLIEVPRIFGGSRYHKSFVNLVAALEHPGVSDRFVLMMDDVFVMEPTTVTPEHRGEISNGAGSEHHHLITLTASWLGAHAKPSRNYELHAPFIFDKERLAEVVGLDVPPRIRDATIRTLYGNWHDIGGTQVTDYKVRPPFDESSDRVFVSTNEAVFRRKAIGAFIRSRFADPSPYERGEP